MSTIQAIGAVCALILTLISIWAKKQAASSTPEQRRLDDEKKVNDAIADGDASVVNDAFNELLETDNSPGNNVK